MIYYKRLKKKLLSCNEKLWEFRRNAEKQGTRLIMRMIKTTTLNFNSDRVLIKYIHLLF